MTKPCKTKTLFGSAIVIAALFIGSVMAQDGFSSLEERMTAKEFRQAGLEKLTPEELAQLNNWIRGHSLGGDAASAQYATTQESGGVGDRRGFRDYRGDRTPITARLKGTFNGWNGETVFELENGMIWKQAEQDKLGVKPRENPEVVIEPGFLSAWYLTIEGVNKKVRVVRVE